MDLRRHVDRFLQRHLPPAGRLLAGVSGGVDSLALAHLLVTLLGADRLVIGHVQHGLRPDADADADAVARLAAAWRVPCHIEHLDLTPAAFSEAAGRAGRYAALAAVARQTGCAHIAVAHHADDQAETVLLHLLRGSGVDGLSGMQPVAPVPVGQAESLTLLRPLLDVPRAALVDYCRRHSLIPRDDASNRDPRFLRNRVRHELLPLLAELAPDVAARLTRLADLAAADSALLHELTDRAWSAVVPATGDGWITLDRAVWRALPLGLRRRVLRRAALHLRRDGDGEIGFETLENARRVAERDAGSRTALLPGGVRLHTDATTIVLRRAAATAPPAGPQLPDDGPLPLPVPGGVTLADGWRLSARWVAPGSEPVTSADPWRVVLQIAADAPLVVRPRRPGEQMQPLGLDGHHKRLTDVMIDRKLPEPLRARWPVVATAAHAVWLVGHVVDERARVPQHPVGPLLALACRPPET